MDSNEKTRLKQDSDQGKPCPITTRLEKRLIIILALVTLVGICLSVALVSYTTGSNLNLQSDDTSKLCLAPQCISTAANLINSMDLTKDPCDDFYSFTCGNWIKNSYLVGDVITQFSKLDNLITLRLKEFLSFKAQNLSEHEKKVKDFYSACMDSDTRNAAGSKLLVEDLEEFGGWPLITENWDISNFNWSKLLIQFFTKGYPKSMLFNIAVELDPKNTSQTLISINQPVLFLERPYYLVSNKVLQGYQELILELAYKLNPKLDLVTAEDDVENAVAIEKRLAKVTLEEFHMKDMAEYYNIFTLKELEKTKPKIPWRYILTNMLPATTILEDNERIMISNPVALNELYHLLEEMDGLSKPVTKTDFANFLFYRIVVYSAQHLGINDFTLFETKLTQKRHLWGLCVGTTLDIFHLSLAGSYAEQYLDNEAKHLLEDMFQDVKEALMNDIRDAEWLDEETIDKALLKVNKVYSTIAYRDEMLDEEKMNAYYRPLKVGENHFTNVKAAYAFKWRQKMEGLHENRIRFRWEESSNLLQANAFYLASENSIIIPIGILYETFFSSGRPNYVNYGSLGTILGHEFTHAFDDAGSLYDEVGNFNMWWTNKSWSSFKEKTECYIKQYDKYYEPQIKAHINGTKTLSENIADNGGLLAAYEAYRGLLNKIGEESLLPGLPFNERQMFWISYASVWCKKQTEYNLMYNLEKNAHAPSKFRIIGTLSNSKEFAEDFKCKSSSALNPKEKCSLWK